MITVEVVLALPRASRTACLQLPAGSTAGDAAAASGLPLEEVVGYAVHGERVGAAAPLGDGDRVELLRPLEMDPKQARRRRAAGARGPG